MIVRNMLSKLKSEAGESLGEVLIALLIAALALTMLASVISTASNIINRSKTAVDRYYAATNELNGLNSSDDVFYDEEKTVMIVNKPINKEVSIKVTDADINSEDYTFKAQVRAYSIVESIASGVKVIAYKK